nr:hypothetical protein BDOA9_0206540 [Bradyrhizobium sp. DOA9]
MMDLGQKQLYEIRADLLPEPILSAAQSVANDQTPTVFAVEGQRLAEASPPIIWDRPSERDTDRSSDMVDMFVVDAASDEPQRIVGAGSLRGTVLHKLMEELLTGELGRIPDEVIRRAAELLARLQSTDETDAARPDSNEMAETALRTLALPELTHFLAQLVPEVPLWTAKPPHFLAGRADAAEGERIALVVDWKSDVNRHGGGTQ